VSIKKGPDAHDAARPSVLQSDGDRVTDPASIGNQQAAQTEEFVEPAPLVRDELPDPVIRVVEVAPGRTTVVLFRLPSNSSDPAAVCHAIGILHEGPLDRRVVLILKRLRTRSLLPPHILLVASFLDSASRPTLVLYSDLPEGELLATYRASVLRTQWAFSVCIAVFPLSPLEYPICMNLDLGTRFTERIPTLEDISNLVPPPEDA
jgi:hypothetical protein